MTLRHLLFIALALLLPLTASAQDAASLLSEGKQAFREGRYEAAARAFERATQQDSDNAEAHYLLARLYYETPLKDDGKAEDALDRAIDLDPDNVVYLVARLQQLRKDSWNFFAERLREMRRIELAKDILELDPDNAFAHEELGSVYIRDFWRYRNALMLPLYAFKYVGIDEGAGRFDYEAQNVGVREGFMPSAADRGLGRFENPNRVFLNDQFDLDALQSQGVPVQDLSVRAQRAYEEAIGHLQQALESDPRRRPVYDDLMEIYALKGEYEAALEMVEDMYRFFPEDAQTWTYLGLAHYHLGNMEAAARSFETALQYMDEGERSAYQDIGFLLTDKEREAYAQDTVAYLARFWASKDPRYLTTYNERRLEHFARLTYADLLYGAPDLDLRGWETQRGSILVRYGQPESDVTITPNDQSYREGKTVVAAAVFRPPQDNEGNVGGAEVRNNPEQLNEMMESRLFQEMNTFNIWEYGDFRFVFEDPFRNGEFRLYSPKASAIGDGQQAWLNDYQIRAKQTFRETPEQYEYEAPGRQIDLPYLTTAFKGAEGQTDLYVHYGVPINEYDGSQEMLEITANTGTFLVSDQRDILVERRNTIYGLPTAQIVSFPDVNLWVDTQVMEAPPGTHDLSVEFETASGNTVAVQRRAVDVPDFEAEAPGLSDLLLAYRVEESLDGEPLGPSEIVRDGLSIQPAPWSVFRVDQPVYVYFETYNLDRNPEGQTDYTVDVLLVPKDDASGIAKLFKNLFGGDKGVSFSFPGTSTSPDVSNYQIVDVSDQEPGVYTLAVRVRDNISGETVESEQELFLEE